MEMIINNIMEWCQNDMEYLQELINELQSIVDNNEDEDFSDHQLNVQSMYDELLQKEENRNCSYGELAYIQSLDENGLNELEEEISNKLESYGD